MERKTENARRTTRGTERERAEAWDVVAGETRRRNGQAHVYGCRSRRCGVPSGMGTGYGGYMWQMLSSECSESR